MTRFVVLSKNFAAAKRCIFSLAPVFSDVTLVNAPFQKVATGGICEVIE